MERRIDPEATLDYVELQMFPSHNRYEACVATSSNAEKVASGDLQQLLLHLPQIKDLSSNSSNSNFKILPPDDVNDAYWFTAGTLTRFLQVVGFSDIISIGNEISQLEETRKFQLSLFAKAEADMTSSFESKNDLLRAMDLRLSELKEKLATALNEATGTRCSPKDISDLGNLAHHIGAEDIRDSLQNFVELSQPPSKDSTNESSVSDSCLNQPVKYGVSPAKVAEIERQSSTDSEASFSSEEDQPSVERSRNLARSATPRRSASPMRRVQIGRSGPRRAATLSIKSLNYFPTREKAATQRDAASSDEESEKPTKHNALRMSVQDKISLFENKQKDQDVDTQKPKTLVVNKAVLRRWSSGMSESATQNLHDTNNETAPVSPKNISVSGNAESCKISAGQSSGQTADIIESPSPKQGGADILVIQVDDLQDERDGSYEKHPSSVDWSQPKEAARKPVRRHSVTNDNRLNSKSQSSIKEQRGGFYDHYKQKRDEKLRKEAAGKKAEKEAQFKEMQKFLDEKKAEMASTNSSDTSRRLTTVNKPQNSQKNITQLPNSRKEAAKPSSLKKALTKPSPLPATRKSWPSTPSPRHTGLSPSRTPSGATPSQARKPQSASSGVRSSTKVENPQSRLKTVKATATQPDPKKSVKTVVIKKQATVPKVAQSAKPKVRTQVDTSIAKPSFYNKVTKKSSVVPLETKPFLRKGTGIGPGVGAVVKSKVITQPEPLVTADLIQVDKNHVMMTNDIRIQNQENECECEQEQESESSVKVDMETKGVTVTPTEPESSNQIYISFDNGINRIDMSENDTKIEEESTISPTAWVEIEEQDEIIPCKETPLQTVDRSNLAAPVDVSSPRVRHSLFQMLLEETGEAESCEWGNAQQPPAMVNQKDAPKGFKRLLKFARKTKTDLNVTDGSSPSSIFRRG